KRLSQPAGRSTSSVRRRKRPQGLAGGKRQRRLGHNQNSEKEGRPARPLFFLGKTGLVEGRASRPSSRATSRRLLRFGDRSEEMKEAFHPCDFQSLMDPLIHAHQPEAASIFCRVT